jgi:hypothetical protein
MFIFITIALSHPDLQTKYTKKKTKIGEWCCAFRMNFAVAVRRESIPRHAHKQWQFRKELLLKCIKINKKRAKNFFLALLITVI